MAGHEPLDREEKLQVALATIRTFFQEHGYAPTLREIMQEGDFASTSVVSSLVDELAARGYLRRVPGLARSIVLQHSRISKPVYDELLVGLQELEDSYGPSSRVDEARAWLQKLQQGDPPNEYEEPPLPARMERVVASHPPRKPVSMPGVRRAVPPPRPWRSR